MVHFSGYEAVFRNFIGCEGQQCEQDDHNRVDLRWLYRYPLQIHDTPDGLQIQAGNIFSIWD